MNEDIKKEDLEYKSVYEYVTDFKNKYTTTIAWRLKKNSEVVEKFLNSGEKVLYAFPAQKNNSFYDMLSTAVVAVTTERLIVGRKRVVFGYFVNSITPDLFNDVKVINGIFWGKVHIDTVKEYICLSNISKSALSEIEQNIFYNMKNKKKENTFRVKE